MKAVIYLLALILSVECNTGEQGKANPLVLDAVSGTVTCSNDEVIYSAWDNTINVFSLDKQSKVFSIKTETTCYAKPVVKNKKIYFPYSDNKFTCVNIMDKSTVWELELNGRCSSFNFIDDTTIVASSKHYGLIAINANNGKILYELKYDYNETHLPDLSPWSIAYNADNIYVSNWQGATLTSFKKSNGALNWKFTDDKSGMAGKAIVFGNKVFLGINADYIDGQIVILDAVTGKLLNGQPCKYEERMEPVVINNSVYFYSFDGSLNRYQLADNSITKLIHFEKDSDISGHQMFLVDGDIYFSDASFNLNSYSIATGNVTLLNKVDKSVIGICKSKGRVFYVN